MSLMGRVSTPGDCMSTSRKVMPSCFFSLRVGPNEHEHPVRQIGKRRPYLLAVDNVVIALKDRPGFEGGQVAA